MSKQVLKQVSPLTSVWVDKENKTMNNKKQSSVEWLVEQLKPAITLQEKYINEFLQQAKAMHKEEIISATYASIRTGDDYYNETFGGDK